MFYLSSSFDVYYRLSGQVQLANDIFNLNGVFIWLNKGNEMQIKYAGWDIHQLNLNVSYTTCYSNLVKLQLLMKHISRNVRLLLYIKD